MTYNDWYLMPSDDNLEPLSFEGLEDIDPYIAKRVSGLIDLNTKAIQQFRRGAHAAIKLRDQTTEIYDDIIEALAVGARMTADRMGDLIALEMGIETVPVEPDADGEAVDGEDE
jgi:hypothetical protein